MKIYPNIGKLSDTLVNNPVPRSYQKKKKNIFRPNFDENIRQKILR